MSNVRVRDVVTNPTARSEGQALPYVALEHVEAHAGRLMSGTELEELTRVDTVIARPGDVLFGKLRPYLDKVVHVDEDIQCSTELLVLRPNPSRVDDRFLYYLALSEPFVEWAVATSVGVKMPRTDWAALSLFEFGSLPPLGEQRNLSAKLDLECSRMNGFSTELAAQHSFLDERDRVAIKRLVTGLDESGPRASEGPWWLGSTPATWTPQKISRNFLTGSGTTPKSGDPRLYGGPHYWLNTAECRDGVVTETAKTVTDEALAEYSSLKFYPVGSLVVAMYGATIGKLAILGSEMTVNQACVVLHQPRELDTQFVYWWLWAHRAELISLGEGGGQPNISQELIRQLVIPAPPLDDQRRIVGEIEELRHWSKRMRDASEQQATLLAERRRAVITAAVTGQMAVV